MQARALRDRVAATAVRRRAAELLGVDRLDGVVQLGLAVGGLFATQLAGGVAFLLGGVAVSIAGRVWDASPAGQED